MEHLITIARQRCYWECNYRVRKDHGFCLAHSSEAICGPIWSFCLGVDANKVLFEGQWCQVFSSRIRELAFQIAEQFRALGDGIGLKQVVVVGGMG